MIKSASRNSRKLLTIRQVHQGSPRKTAVTVYADTNTLIDAGIDIVEAAVVEQTSVVIN